VNFSPTKDSVASIFHAIIGEKCVQQIDLF